jgi:hypothetical protein
MGIRRSAVVAGLTVVTVSSVGHAILPSSSADQGSRLDGQYSVARRAELKSARLRANELGYAINADGLRSAEVREAEKVAGGVVGSLLRRP